MTQSNRLVTDRDRSLVWSQHLVVLVCDKLTLSFILTNQYTHASLFAIYMYVCVYVHVHTCVYTAVAVDPIDMFDPPDRETMRLQKFGKLLAGPNTDLGETGYCIIIALYTHVGLYAGLLLTCYQYYFLLTWTITLFVVSGGQEIA